MKLWPFGRRSAVPPAPTFAGLEVGAIRSLAEAEVEARHPLSGEPLGAFFLLASPDHPARLQARIDIARGQRGDEEMDSEEAITTLGETAVEFLSRIVLGWRNVKSEGDPLPWSGEAARLLFARPDLRWLVNQLLQEAARTENFIEASAPG
jgi:hypothetical protein